MASKSQSFQGAGLHPRHLGTAPKSQAANLFPQNITAGRVNSITHHPFLPRARPGTFEAAFLQSSLKKEKDAEGESVMI